MIEHTHRSRPFRVLAAVALLALAGVATIPILARSRAAAVRQIDVVVRGMTYYVDGQDTPNPTLRVKRGQRLRIVVRNQDSGMSHDLTIRAWEAGTRLLRARDEDVLELRAPDATGETAYSCTPHAAMMRGTIIVE